MSAPAAKAFSEPVSTMQPTPLSFSNPSSALLISAMMPLLSAFSACGRSRVMRPTAPRVSTLIIV